MKKGVFTTEIYLNSRFASDEVVLPAVSHSDAETIVKYIRNGIYGNMPSAEGYDSPNESPYKENKVEKEDLISKLHQLNELKNSGVITEEEFNQLKKKCMDL